jgi:glycosyltransferase involved in cell wall biosynthesis
MTSAAPRVTVIIPTYNWSSVLPYSIGSVLRQSFADFELLVIGDGCTDDSESIVAGIADPRVSWINLPVNTGHQSAPNNEGLRRARGELIAYLGHDDLWLPHHLSALIGEIDAGADLAYAMSALVGPEESFFDVAPPSPVYRSGMSITPSSLMHRREVTERIGGWRNFREIEIDPEADLCARAHGAGLRLVFLPRLTSVKFPAAWRRNAYRRRISADQAAWFARIGRETDFEQREIIRLIYAGKQGQMLRMMPYRQLWQGLWRETLRRIGLRISVRQFKLAGKGRRIVANRRYKGLG